MDVLEVPGILIILGVPGTLRVPRILGTGTGNHFPDVLT